MRAISSETACALAAPSISRHGTTMRWSATPAHSTNVTATLPLVPCFRALRNSDEAWRREGAAGGKRKRCGTDRTDQKPPAHRGLLYVSVSRWWQAAWRGNSLSPERPIDVRAHERRQAQAAAHQRRP